VPRAAAWAVRWACGLVLTRDAPLRQVDSAIKREPGKRLKRGALLKVLALELPEEDLEHAFRTLVRWAQAGDLFDYDEEADELMVE